MHVGAVSVLEGAPFFDADGRLPDRRRARPRVVAPAAHAALPPPAHDGAVRAGPADLGRRRPVRHHVPRAAHRACRSPGSWEQLVALDHAHPGRSARPRAAAVGDLVGRRPRRRQRRAVAEDAPRVDRRRVGRRRRDAAARPAARVHRRRSSPTGPRSPRRARRSCCSTRCTSASPNRRRSCVRSARCSRGPRRARRTGARDRAVDEHDGDARRDRAAHVAQRSHRPAPAARGRARSAGRRQGDPPRSRRHGERRRARGVSGGLRRLFVHRGDDTEDLQLRVLCPVSVRSDDQRGSLGNKVSAMFVNLPVDNRPAVERLRGDLGADRRPQGAAPGRRRRDAARA